MRKGISLIVFVATLVFAAGAAAQVTVLTHATVIDGTGAAARRDFAVVMEGGRIRELGPASSIATPPGAAVVDLTGKFIVPGIINAHGHVGANPEPQPGAPISSRFGSTAKAASASNSAANFAQR